MKISRKIFLATVASVCLTATVQAQSLREINFGIISTDSSSALKSLWQPFLDDMSKATGLKINSFFATDYTGIIEGMRFGKVQVAWHGNKSAIEAVDRAGVARCLPSLSIWKVARAITRMSSHTGTVP